MWPLTGSIAAALRSRVRCGTETDKLIAGLAGNCEVALLSGDNEKERGRFAALFGPGAHLLFNQSPLDKLNFIKRQQASGKTVMMVGDGLNDAGALKQSDVGVAVVEKVSAFSPASDVILAAGMVVRMAEVLRYARQSVRVVRLSFLISAVYNAVGVAIAASGQLSPVVCAILMPLSSVTVVAFACGAATWFGRGIGGAPSTARQGRAEIFAEPRDARRIHSQQRPHHDRHLPPHSAEHRDRGGLSGGVHLGGAHGTV